MTTTHALARFTGMSVLVVDDNPSNVALLKTLLEGQGMSRVYTETDSRRLSRRLSEDHPDLVLLDLHMPYIDGHEALRQITAFAAGSYLPVLVLTADTNTLARDRALSEGAHDFLIKPLDTTETALRIANLLQTRQLYTTLRRGVAQELPDPLDQHEARSRTEGVLRERSIVPAYQPVFDINTMAVVGYEGLSRFPDPTRPPDRWFADAFASGLGVELEWLAAQTMLPLLRTVGAEAFLAINMSPATILRLADQEFCSPEACSRIVVELTEHVPVENYDAVHRALAEMRSHGAKLAADDLGSSYAGFRHLIRLNPDIIKLDISLIRGIHRSNAQRALSSALATFARDIGATVIAEGVEEAAELDVLRAIGIPWAQGYHLGRPAPAPMASVEA